MQRLRKLLCGASGAAGVEAVRGLDVEGGLAGRMRVLYQVPCLAIFPWLGVCNKFGKGEEG